ncbi:MAG: acetolactate decarboxylase [Arcobacteraceae bacterium]
MKLSRYTLPLMLFCSLLTAENFNFKSYGNFSNIIQKKDLSSKVSLNNLKLNNKGVYATGALANAEGEITVFDGNVFISLAKTGKDVVINEVKSNPKAMLLAVGTVNTWSEPIEVEEDVLDLDFYDLLANEAVRLGIESKTFVFKIEGEFNDVRWHIVNDKNDEKPIEDDKQPPMRKLYMEESAVGGIVFGFYTFGEQGIFTHPGESYHAHAIFNNQTQAGHIDNFTIKAGSKIYIGVE